MPNFILASEAVPAKGGEYFAHIPDGGGDAIVVAYNAIDRTFYRIMVDLDSGSLIFSPQDVVSWARIDLPSDNWR